MRKSPDHQITRSPVKAAIKKLSAVFATCVVCLVTCDLYAQSVTSAELISKARQYDGQAVIYKGEAIGDVMRRGQYAWINVNDGNNAIGIWTPTEIIPKIILTGKYTAAGDLVEISGIFHRSCAEHGGDLDIHARALRTISSGYPVTETAHFDKVKLAFTLALITVLVWILSLLNKR